MRLISSVWSRLSATTRRNRNRATAEAGDDTVQVPWAHQPPSWLGWLLLITLLVMLNTHMFITLAAGIDQYSLYAADSAVPQLYPALLAQQPYPVLLPFVVNVLLAFLAYGVYRLIWRYFTTQRATSSDGSGRNPFKQNAVALAIPVFIAMAPSLVLCYTVLKPYFVIVGALIAIVLCIVGALKDPDVDLDSSTRGYWFNVAVVATFVMMTLAVVVTLYFQFAPVEPPNDNLLWRLEWDPSPLEGFEQRVRGGMLLFGLVSIAYMVVVVGGVLLATLHPPRIGARTGESLGTAGGISPASQPGPPHGANTPVINRPVGVAEHRPQAEPQTGELPATPEPASRHAADLPEEDYPTREPGPLQGAGIPKVNIPVDGTVEEWAEEVLTLLEKMSVESGQAPSYLAVVSGQEVHITESAYTLLVDERTGFLAGVDLFVDQSTEAVRVRRGTSLETVRIVPDQRNARYHGVLLYSRQPYHRFTTEELRNRLERATGREIPNINDVPSRLKSLDIPLELARGETFIKADAKVVLLVRLSTEELMSLPRRHGRPAMRPEDPERA